MIALGTLSCLGYGPLDGVTLLGMPFLDFFDFLTNSVMMPVAALAICLLVNRRMGVDRVALFRFMIRWACPLFVTIILVSSVANVLGFIKM